VNGQHWRGFDEAARRMSEVDGDDPRSQSKTCELKADAAYHEAMLTDDPAMADELIRASEGFRRAAGKFREAGR
jgi:hypothetical protein